jgi:hypothetical protein
MRPSRILVILLSAGLLAAGVAAFQSTTAIAGGTHGFVGAGKCKTCHGKDDIGNQQATWLSSAHAKAWETLGTDKAKAKAAEKGLGDPQQAQECIRCHVTAWDAPEELRGSKVKQEEGVTCEGCHGAGKDYRKKAIMVDKDQAVAAGLVPDASKICTDCHNTDSPYFEGFDYDSAWKKIAHPVPEAYDPFAEDE